MSHGLLLGAGLSLVVAATFGRVGWFLAGRSAPSDDDRLANAMFGVWWLGLAASSALGAATNILAAAGALSLRSAVALQALSLTAICIALWALLYYLTFLFTGRRRYFWPLAVGYLVYAGWLFATMASWGPSSVQVSGWQATVVYAHPGQGLALIVLGALLLGPQMLAALALYGLAARLPGGPSRRRVLSVATGILLWFGSAVAGSATSVNGSVAWSVVQQGIGVLVAVMILAAYRPATVDQRGEPAVQARTGGDVPSNPP